MPPSRMASIWMVEWNGKTKGIPKWRKKIERTHVHKNIPTKEVMHQKIHQNKSRMVSSSPSTAFNWNLRLLLLLLFADALWKINTWYAMVWSNQTTQIKADFFIFKTRHSDPEKKSVEYEAGQRKNGEKKEWNTCHMTGKIFGRFFSPLFVSLSFSSFLCYSLFVANLSYTIHYHTTTCWEIFDSKTNIFAIYLIK